jgi:hypothetical protein
MKNPKATTTMTKPTLLIPIDTDRQSRPGLSNEQPTF